MLILLDRDGVINENRDDYVKNPGEFVMIPGSAEAISKLNNAGFLVAIVTNQSAIGRGIISEDMLNLIHNKMRDDLAKAGAWIDKIYFAADAPHEATPRRKPGPGMVQEALMELRSVASDTILIGDSLRDLEAAASCNVARILVRTGHGAKVQSAGLPPHVLPVKVKSDLADAVDGILSAHAEQMANLTRNPLSASRETK